MEDIQTLRKRNGSQVKFLLIKPSSRKVAEFGMSEQNHRTEYFLKVGSV